MTRSTAKPKLHPTFTLDELRVMRSLLSEEPDYIFKKDQRHIASALEKITNAIVYREDILAKIEQAKRTAREAKPNDSNHT